MLEVRAIAGPEIRTTVLAWLHEVGRMTAGSHNFQWRPMVLGSGNGRDRHP
ncbi:hypothetical protein BH11ACT8_BH11ACT8_24840 [soil metagenome]